MAAQLSDSALDKHSTPVCAAIRSVDGFAWTATQGRSRVSFAALAGWVAVAVLLVVALLLSRRWPTYSNETLGFAVDHPATWEVEEQRIVQLHSISFAPYFYWLSERRRLEIQVIGGSDESEWTSEDYLSYLEDTALGNPRATILTLRARDIDSRPGAEMAFEIEGTAMWVAVCGTREYRYMLGTMDDRGNTEGLESLHARFVDSFRLLERE